MLHRIQTRTLPELSTYPDDLYQEVSIFRFFKYRYRDAYTELDVRQTLHIDIPIIRRALKQLTANNRTAPWRDLKGRSPLVRLKERRKDVSSGKEMSLYQWNPKYNRTHTSKQFTLFNFIKEVQHEN